MAAVGGAAVTPGSPYQPFHRPPADPVQHTVVGCLQPLRDFLEGAADAASVPQIAEVVPTTAPAAELEPATKKARIEGKHWLALFHCLFRGFRRAYSVAALQHSTCCSIVAC